MLKCSSCQAFFCASLKPTFDFGRCKYEVQITVLSTTEGPMELVTWPVVEHLPSMCRVLDRPLSQQMMGCSTWDTVKFGGLCPMALVVLFVV